MKRAVLYSVLLAVVLALAAVLVCWPRRNPQIEYNIDSEIPVWYVLLFGGVLLVSVFAVSVTDYFVCTRLSWPPALTCPFVAAALHIALTALVLVAWALVRLDADVLEVFADLWYFHLLGALTLAATAGPLNAVLIVRAKDQARGTRSMSA